MRHWFAVLEVRSITGISGPSHLIRASVFRIVPSPRLKVKDFLVRAMDDRHSPSCIKAEFPPHAPAIRLARHMIEAVSPSVDGGRFPVKRIAGEDCVVEADIFRDGHEVIKVASQAGRHFRSGAHDTYWQRSLARPIPIA